MKYELSQEIEFDNRKFQVIDDLSQNDEEKKRKSSLIANVIAVLLFAAVIALGFFAIRWIHPPRCFPITIWTFVILIGGYIAYTFVHEFIRAFIYILPGGAKLKDLSMGVVLSQGMVYCISKTPIRLRRVRVSLLLPFFIVFLPIYALGLYFGDITYVFAGALALTVSVTDFYLMHELRKHKGSLFLLEEKPVKEGPAGYILKEIVSVDAFKKESSEE